MTDTYEPDGGLEPEDDRPDWWPVRSRAERGAESKARAAVAEHDRRCAIQAGDHSQLKATEIAALCRAKVISRAESRDMLEAEPQEWQTSPPDPSRSVTADAGPTEIASLYRAGVISRDEARDRIGLPSLGHANPEALARALDLVATKAVAMFINRQRARNHTHTPTRR